MMGVEDRGRRFRTSSAKAAGPPRGPGRLPLQVFDRLQQPEEVALFEIGRVGLQDVSPDVQGAVEPFHFSSIEGVRPTLVKVSRVTFARFGASPVASSHFSGVGAAHYLDRGEWVPGVELP